MNANNNDAANAVTDNLKRDRFELLSAYLDGEVTASERQQVEAWLKTDPKAQQLYSRLLNLRQAFRHLPAPPVEEPVEKTVQQVVSKLERKSKRKYVWGGMAIAAMFVSALVGGLPRLQYASNATFAEKPHIAVPDDALMIALDRPLIDLPQEKTDIPSHVLSSPRRNIE